MPAQILFGLLSELFDIRHRRSGIYLPWVGVASRSAQMRPTQHPKVVHICPATVFWVVSFYKLGHYRLLSCADTRVLRQKPR